MVLHVVAWRSAKDRESEELGLGYEHLVVVEVYENETDPAGWPGCLD